MGEVWAASDEKNGSKKEVALKILLQRAAMKPDLVKRFAREAKITSSIDSPFVCKLLDFRQAPDGTHILVFEHLTGESLADRLKREQYLPLSEVGPLIDDVLQGLSAAHAAGVIHRDLKPGNIFLVDTGNPNDPERAKVLDFGISKLVGREKEEPTLTAFDATLGSFAYMAPEQIRGAARADVRADIYAVGAVAFRALSGRLPFEGSSAAVLVSLKLDRNAPSLEEVTGERWPSGVERFLERALDREREGRFESAEQALESWRAIQPQNITKAQLPPSNAPASRNAPPLRQSAVSFPSISRVVDTSPKAVPSPPPSAARSKAIPPPTPSRPHAPPPPPSRSQAPPAKQPSTPPATPSYVDDAPTEVDDNPPTMTGTSYPGRPRPSPPTLRPPSEKSPRSRGSSPAIKVPENRRRPRNGGR